MNNNNNNSVYATNYNIPTSQINGKINDFDKYLPHTAHNFSNQYTNHFFNTNNNNNDNNNNTNSKTNVNNNKNSNNFCLFKLFFFYFCLFIFIASPVEKYNEALLSNENKNNPFPSLNKRVTSKPPLPNNNEKQHYAMNNQGFGFSSMNSYNNNLESRLNSSSSSNGNINDSANILYDQQNLIRTNSFNSRLNRNVNMYDPFPSLSAINTAVPELYSNIGHKFRKTKLW